MTPLRRSLVPREKQQVPVSSLLREMAFSKLDSLGGLGLAGRRSRPEAVNTTPPDA